MPDSLSAENPMPFLCPASKYLLFSLHLCTTHNPLQRKHLDTSQLLPTYSHAWSCSCTREAAGLLLRDCLINQVWYSNSMLGMTGMTGSRGTF